MAVQTEGHRPPMPVQRMAAAEAVPAPSFEAGVSSITVRVSGAIESPPGAR